MTESIVVRSPDGHLEHWRRCLIRDLAGRGVVNSADESFLEDLIGKQPDLLGLADGGNNLDIEGGAAPPRSGLSAPTDRMAWAS